MLLYVFSQALVYKYLVADRATPKKAAFNRADQIKCQIYFLQKLSRFISYSATIKSVKHLNKEYL